MKAAHVHEHERVNDHAYVDVDVVEYVLVHVIVSGF
jgi:hypothetical protein